MRYTFWKYSRHLFIVFILLSQFSLFGQNTNSYFENLILNTDRDVYIAGEKIWFNINCFDNEFEDILSKIIYIELYDYKTNVIVKHKFRIEDGKVTGCIKIPDNQITGNYYLRTYTKYLRNYPSELFPTKVVSIINPNKPQYIYDSLYHRVTIVPEGRKLLAGIKNKLAIVISKNILKDVKDAVIINKNNKEISKIVLPVNGITLVEITPQENEFYYLNLVLKDSIFKIALPKVEKDEFLFQSYYRNNQSFIKISSNHKGKDKFKLVLLSESFQKLIEKQLSINEEYTIPHEFQNRKFIYALLKDTSNNIIDIKCHFIGNSNSQKINVSTSKVLYSTRDKVSVNLNLPDEISDSSEIQVSVFKNSNFENRNDLPYYLGSSPISISNYLYANNCNSDSIIKQLEALMILYSNSINTKGFIKKIRILQQVHWLPEIRDVSISGQVIDKSSNTPLKNTSVVSSVFNSNNQIHLTKTDNKGRFVFSLNHLEDIQYVFIGTTPNDSVKTKILVDNDYSVDFPKTSMIPLNIKESEQETLNQLSRNTQLLKAFEYAHKEPLSYNTLEKLPIEDQIKTIWLKDFVKTQKMGQVIDELIPFVSKRKRKNIYSLRIYNNVTKEFYDNPMLIIDGIPFFDVNQFMNISPELIEKFEIINKQYQLGGITLNGIIRVTTNTKDFAGLSFPKESVFINYQTTTQNRMPNFPNYTNGSKSKIPDFRNLLYWNSFNTNKSKYPINFYTSDDTGEYIIKVKILEKGKFYLGNTKIKIQKKNLGYIR